MCCKLPNKRQLGAARIKSKNIITGIYGLARDLPFSSLARWFPSYSPLNLPDAHSLSGWAIHTVSRFDVKRVVPPVHVRQHSKHAKFVRAVYISHGNLSQLCRADLGAGYLRIGHEESLIAGQSANHWRWLSMERGVVGI